MKATCLFIAILLFGPPAFSQTQYSRQTLEKIKEVENNVCGRLIINDEKSGTITGRMAKYNVKGLSIAVIHDHKIAWAKGYGWADEAEKRPVTPETLFEPGSISKCLNAVGILKLAQDKKVDLYTDINSYLTSWKFPYDSLSKGKKISLAHLLSHTGGLSVHGFPGHDIKGPIPTVYEVLDGKQPSFTPAVRSVFEPGLRFQYSGGGTTISQVLLSDVTKQPYDTWMYENVLKPIGMVNSTYAQPPAREKQALCASAYRRDGTPLENKFHVYPEQGAAGLWMTPSDLCHYIIDMQEAYQGKPSKVLTSEMVKLHLSPFNNGPTALGTFIEDHSGSNYFQHGAGNDGFCGQFYGSLDEGYGVALFLNTDDPRILSEVINSVAKAYNWKNFYHEPKIRKSISVPDAVLKTYEGVYLFENNWAAIGKKDKDYHFYTDHSYVKMYYSTPTHFFNEEFASEKEFIKDGQGNILGYTRTVDGKEFPKATKITKIDTLKLESEVFGDIAWYLFEAKKYDESIAYYQRGVQLYPGNLFLLSNMAHVYLYKNDYNSAIAIYKAHLKEMIEPGLSWEKMMQDDLTWFKRNGYDIKIFDKVFAELKIQKPEGY
jgi:CubicO group peptidase (beta-lactamase class C family)